MESGGVGGGSTSNVAAASSVGNASYFGSNSGGKDHVAAKSLDLTTSASTGVVGSNSPPGPGGVSASGTGGGNEDPGQIRFLRSKVSELFQELKRLVEEPDVFVPPQDESQPPVVAAPNAWRIVPLVPQFDVMGRTVFPSVDEENFEEDVSLFYRKNAKSDVVTVKMKLILPYSMEEVAPYLADVSWHAVQILGSVSPMDSSFALLSLQSFASFASWFSCVVAKNGT
jgi:hypothetical protein